ncbi:hypothetical protein L1D14_09165 [Vibrio tubiashii]|nr:hypothetical protein [Vibrio tubiashii]MCG9576407.1 hypothetical protein [Vibrio tubiashii]
MLDNLLTVVTGVFSIYAIFWSVPGSLMSAVISLGNPQRIAFIDYQLSKDVESLRTNGNSMLSYYISTRLFGYWIAYPFIRRRSKVKSLKFSIFMTVNSLGMWSWLVALSLNALTKALFG